MWSLSYLQFREGSGMRPYSPESRCWVGRSQGYPSRRERELNLGPHARHQVIWYIAVSWEGGARWANFFQTSIYCFKFNGHTQLKICLDIVSEVCSKVLKSICTQKCTWQQNYFQFITPSCWVAHVTPTLKKRLNTRTHTNIYVSVLYRQLKMFLFTMRNHSSFIFFLSWV